MKNINSKKIVYGERISIADSSMIKELLKNGEVNFSKSNTRNKPCGLYVIEDTNDDNQITLTLQNCDSVVKLLNLQK